MLSDLFDTYPWFLPGLLIVLPISIAASGPVARRLGVRRPLAWLLLVGFGVVLAATLTPGRETFDFGFGPGGFDRGFCDMRRMRPAMSALLSINNSSLNVLLLIPLGVAIGLLPRSRAKVVILVLAIALPFTVEFIQALVPALGRQCESGDVIDNSTGLIVGLVIGTILGVLIPTLARGDADPDHPADGPGPTV